MKNKARENYLVQMRKLCEQRTTVAHRGIGTLSAIVQMNGEREDYQITPGVMELIEELVHDYNNFSEQIKHTDLLIDLVDQKMDEA